MRVFLSHSTKDGDFVKKLAEELRGRKIVPWLCEVDIEHTQDFIQKINRELAQTDLVVLIWSSEADASKWTHEELTFALKRHVEIGTFLVTVRLREHPLLPLLETKIFFDCRQDQKRGTEDLLAWLERQRDMREAGKQDARLQKLDYEPESFTGREAFFERFHMELVTRPGRVLVWGAPGNGKTTLALKFAWRARGAFDTVIFQTCGDRPLASIVNELAAKIDPSWISDPHEVQIPKIKERLASARSLLVLDDVWREDMMQLIPGPNASVLVTSRFRTGVTFPVLPLSGFDREEQRQYLTQNLSSAEWTGRWLEQLQDLAGKYDGSPLALSTIVQQLQETYGPHDDALRSLRFSSIEEMLRDFAARQPETAKRLLEAVAVCAPQGVWLPFAARVAGMSPEEMAKARDHLVNNSLMRVVDRDEQRYNLHALLHKAVASDALRSRHANAVLEVFQNPEDWQSCQCCAEEVDAALDYWQPAETFYDLAYAAFDVFWRTGLFEGAFEVIKRCKSVAEAEGDRDRQQRAYANSAVILKGWDRLDEAMALLLKQETLCIALGDKANLQCSYHFQAAILKDRGRLEEAMALLRKQEDLCEDINDRNWLQRCYGNQAQILHNWGRLDEAMALNKKKEALAIEFRNRNSIARAYNNEAGILKDWNRLDEALQLLEKAVALCEEIGDKALLAHSLLNRGLVFQKLTLPVEARKELSRALAIFTSLKMPRDRDEVQKALHSLNE